MSPRTGARFSRDECLNRIKTAALACFTEKGYAGTTVAEIARRAGLSPAALYLHVESKRALFDSLGREDLDRPTDHTLLRSG
jgi:AcrR family transcriptional regulator